MIVLDEEIPSGEPQLPKTGEGNPISFYVMGLLFTATGIRMRKVI